VYDDDEEDKDDVGAGAGGRLGTGEDMALMG
jgi:hypothetical protein